MKNKNIELKTHMIGFRLTNVEFKQFQEWKRSENLESNTTALRRALAIAIENKGGESLE